MANDTKQFDVVVIGSGPAGQKAAVHAAQLGKSTAIIEREATVGGWCVHRGTIPSKSLRETASKFVAGAPDERRERTKMQELMERVDDTVGAHVSFMAQQLERNKVEVFHGRARFAGPHEVEVSFRDGTKTKLSAELIFVAVGSVPRLPSEIPVDHEHILDSDSVLSLAYVPDSLTVIGSGVIACEYASVFAHLGCRVTMLDKYPSPLGFLDKELVTEFVNDFEGRGGVFRGNSPIASVAWDGVSKVVTTLESGEIVESDKMLVAQGRVASGKGLNLEAAGLTLNERGHIPVREHGQTEISHIYAAGDVAGPPALATTSMEQGRRAVRHALGHPIDGDGSQTPIGIYTLPEMSSVGLTEEQAKEKFPELRVGRARFEEIARAHISGDTKGLLKLVVGPNQRLVGAHCIGYSACELIHLAHMAMLGDLPVTTFVDSVFNFPTMAEAYRIATLESGAY